MIKGIGYIRVSRKGKRGQEGNGAFLSPELQRATIERLARSRGIKIVAWREDINESGKKWERDGFQEALAMLEAGIASVMVCSKLTRFARSVPDTYKALSRMAAIEPVPARLVTEDFDYDLNTSTGKMMLGILAVLAQFELDRVTEGWGEATQASLSEGRKLSRAPLGYVKAKGGSLKKDKATAPVIREAFRMFAAGATQRAVARMIEERTGQPFWPGSVSRPGRVAQGGLIQNRAYRGEHWHAGQLVNAEAWPAIVTEEEWQAAQREAKPQARRSAVSLLAGIARCGHCGGGMNLSRRPASSGGVTYRCGGRNGHSHRPQNAIKADWLEAYLETDLLAWAGAEQLEGVRNDQPLVVALAEQAKAEDALSTFLVSGVRDAISPDQYKRAAQSLQAEVDRTTEQVNALRAANGVEAVRLTLAERWPMLDQDGRRALIQSVVDHIEIAPSNGRRYVPAAERATIVYRD